MNTEQMERVVREVLTAAVDGDLHLLQEHPGMVDLIPMYQVATAAFSERTVRFPLQFSDGEEWVASRVIEGGRHTAEFMGLPPTGEYGEWEMITLHQFQGDKIVAQHSQADMGAWLRTMGAALPFGE